MKTKSKNNFQTTVATRVAGEDIKQGDYVTVLNEVIELPSFLWSCSGASLPPDEPVHTQYMAGDAGQPYKVMTVCLPFVYAKRAMGGVNVIDIRQQQLVRLDRNGGRAVWKHIRKALQTERSSCRSNS